MLRQDASFDSIVTTITLSRVCLYAYAFCCHAIVLIYCIFNYKAKQDYFNLHRERKETVWVKERHMTRHTRWNVDIKHPTATALLSNTACLSLALDSIELSECEFISSTDISSTVTSVSRDELQLFTIQTSDAALPQTALNTVPPALDSLSSTCTAVTHTHRPVTQC